MGSSMGDVKLWLMKTLMGWWRTSDAGRKNSTSLRPESNISVRKLQLLINKCGDFWRCWTSHHFYFVFFVWPAKESSYIGKLGAQIINNCVWYSHNIPPMIKKKSNLKITQSWTKATGLCIMIGRYSPDNQHRRPSRRTVNIGWSFFHVHEWQTKEPHKSET